MDNLDNALNVTTSIAHLATQGNVYFGIADCHGIESFRQLSVGNAREISLLQFRAHANDQRHAVVYIAALNSQMITQIEASIRKRNYTQALLLLKCCEQIYFIEKRYSRLWDNIPNPKLDPWGG